MKRISIVEVHAAATFRKQGYVDAVTKAGRLDGAVIILEDATYEAIREQYKIPGLSSETHNPIGKHRFRICQGCPQTSDKGFGCSYHKGCCFGSWRSQPENSCPMGQWSAWTESGRDGSPSRSSDL